MCTVGPVWALRKKNSEYSFFSPLTPVVPCYHSKKNKNGAKTFRERMYCEVEKYLWKLVFANIAFQVSRREITCFAIRTSPLGWFPEPMFPRKMKGGTHDNNNSNNINSPDFSRKVSWAPAGSASPLADLRQLVGRRHLHPGSTTRQIVSDNPTDAQLRQFWLFLTKLCPVCWLTACWKNEQPNKKRRLWKDLDKICPCYRTYHTCDKVTHPLGQIFSTMWKRYCHGATCASTVTHRRDVAEVITVVSPVCAFLCAMEKIGREIGPRGCVVLSPVW